MRSPLARFLLQGASYRMLDAREAGELLEIAARFECALRKIVADADQTHLGEQLLARVAFEALNTCGPLDRSLDALRRDEGG